MAYHQDNNYFITPRRRYNGIKYGLLFVFCAGVVFVFYNFFKGFSYRTMVPVLEASNAVERGLYSLTHSKQNLLNRVNDLESENAELRLKMVDYDLLQNENSGFKNSVIEKSDTVVATVVSKPSAAVYDTLVIKSSDVVNTGNDVYTLSGIPIGSVTSFMDGNGTVTLYSSPSTETVADILLEDAMDSISVTMRGRGGGGFEAILPKEVKIPVGSLAVKPSLFGEPFAEVVKTVSRDDTKDQIVYLRSIVNFQYLRYIAIGK